MCFCVKMSMYDFKGIHKLKIPIPLLVLDGIKLHVADLVCPNVTVGYKQHVVCHFQCPHSSLNTLVSQ